MVLELVWKLYQLAKWTFYTSLIDQVSPPCMLIIVRKTNAVTPQANCLASIQLHISKIQKMRTYMFSTNTNCARKRSWQKMQLESNSNSRWIVTLRSTWLCRWREEGGCYSTLRKIWWLCGQLQPPILPMALPVETLKLINQWHQTTFKLGMKKQLDFVTQE